METAATIDVTIVAVFAAFRILHVSRPSLMKYSIQFLTRTRSSNAGLLTEFRHRRPIIQRIDAFEDERRALYIRLADLETIDPPMVPVANISSAV
jgi:hypothetical protein